MCAEPYKKKPDYEVWKLERKIGRRMARLNGEFDLIGEGDRLLVAVSGGKDSMVMLHMLQRMQRIAPFSFEMVACHLDQGQPGFRSDAVEEHLRQQGIPYVMLHVPSYDIVQSKLKPGETRCALCSRLRRGALYSYASENDFNKIALGHHADDLIETLLLNVFFAGQIKSMPPKLISNDRRNIVVRPLALVPEDWLRKLAELKGFRVVACRSCSEQDDLERPNMKAMLTDLMRRNPKVKSNLLASLSNVCVTHLMDPLLAAFAARHDEE